MINEFETRKIIDKQLRKVGWEVDSNNLRYSKGTRPQKGRNIAIAEYPTKNGFADYVLFVGTNAVAVIEAKTNYKDVSAVIDCQCKEYSRTLCGVDEIDDFCGYKVPFTFATNGRAYCKQLEIKSSEIVLLSKIGKSFRELYEFFPFLLPSLLKYFSARR